MDSVSYSSGFPWPISANALGADEEWTGINQLEHQYRGRSLERVSATASSNDPANWLASPLPGEPSPGKPNAIVLNQPNPVVLNLHVAQAADGQQIIRADQAVRVDCLFSDTNVLSEVRLEYFVDDVNVTNEPRTTLEMVVLGYAQAAGFFAELPGQKDRSIVRYRILADRGHGIEAVSPRADDPFAWHAYFVTPVRNSQNPVYDLFISGRSLSILQTNISQEPKRYTRPDPPGLPRRSWDATQPAVFVYNGIVRDVQMRHHGSQFRREVSRRSYKLQFPRYSLFNDHSSVFLTDKDYQTVAGHTLFRAVGLPTSLTRWVDLYMNNTARLPRLEQEEYDEYLLERYHTEQFQLHPDRPPEEPGEIYKAMGVFDPAGGPYGRAEGKPLPARAPLRNALKAVRSGDSVLLSWVGTGSLQIGDNPNGPWNDLEETTNPDLVEASTGNRFFRLWNAVSWTPLQRYEWTYALQNHGWSGHTAFQNMLDQMWVARNRRTSAPGANEIPQLRAYFAENWDLDKTLTYLATINWLVPWDDTIHNYFLWQQRNGKWSMLPWDFDSEMDGQPSSASIFTGTPFAGPNYFKESFIAAYRQEFKERMWWLNNTVLHPENLTALGIDSRIRTWANARFKSVNTQCGLGIFERPGRPINVSPADGQVVVPFASLQASEYTHSTNPIGSHTLTTWTIRSAEGSYYTPVYELTTTNDLVSLPIPFHLLRFGETYFWKCQYVDTNGHASLPSIQTSFTYGGTILQPGELVLNEILADNRASIANGTRYPDYVELHNPSDEPKILDGWSLSDDLFFPQKFVFPSHTMIAPRGYLLVWCDSRNNAPGLHTGFGLNADGQIVALYGLSKNGPVLRDLVRFGLQLPDLSIGRITPGLDEWTLNVPTPNRPNERQTLAPSTALKIHEWMAEPGAGADWFEILNAESSPVALGGLYFTDNLDVPEKSLVPPLSFLGAGSLRRFIADGDPDNGSDHVRFKLSGNGSSLGIYASDGSLIDAILFGPQAPGMSQRP